MSNIDMDRIIEKKKGISLVFSRKSFPYWVAVLFVVLILFLVFRDNKSTLRVDREGILVCTVQTGEFNDYIRISGQVQPMITIQLSPLEDGVVSDIYIEEGAKVNMVAEGGVYMRDYTEDENGQIARVSFDFIKDE